MAISAHLQTNRKSTARQAAKALSSKAVARKSTQRNAGVKNKQGPVDSDIATKELKEQIFSYKSADDKNALTIIEVVRAGISVKDFNKIFNATPFSLTEWSHFLQLSERTIQRNQKKKRPFNPFNLKGLLS